MIDFQDLRRYGDILTDDYDEETNVRSQEILADGTLYLLQMKDGDVINIEEL